MVEIRGDVGVAVVVAVVGGGGGGGGGGGSAAAVVVVVVVIVVIIIAVVVVVVVVVVAVVVASGPSRWTHRTRRFRSLSKSPGAIAGCNGGVEGVLKGGRGCGRGW